MSTELFTALFKRKQDVENGGQTWESDPAPSSADVPAHLQGLPCDAPPAQEWLQKLDPTPEEDALASALADGLIARAGEAPEHVPAKLSEKDASRLRQLEEALRDMQRRLEEKDSNLEELTKQLAEREQRLREEQEQQQRREEARRNYPQPVWLIGIEDTVNIGVVGNAGVGKSLLINKLRRVRPQAPGWAPVGVKETTAVARAYPFPGEPRVRLWDLPGAGTSAVPSETYVQEMGLRYFDKVLIVTAGRFTAMEVELKAELEQHKVPYFMVRTKVDIDVWNNDLDNGMDPKNTTEQIRTDLQSHAVTKPFLVSSRDPEAYDMPKLERELFPGLKRTLDPTAPAFCPSDPPSWSSAWAMPPVYSQVLAGLQGRWVDAFHSVYLVQGASAHVSMAAGQCVVVPFTQAQGAVNIQNGRWFVNEQSIKQAQMTGELRWTAANIKDPPMFWRWYD